jgi:hypothetical protein
MSANRSNQLRFTFSLSSNSVINNFSLTIKSPSIEAVRYDFLDSHGVSLRVLRLAEILPVMYGNK